MTANEKPRQPIFDSPIIEDNLRNLKYWRIGWAYSHLKWYDHLFIALGGRHKYFMNDWWERDNEWKPLFSKIPRLRCDAGCFKLSYWRRQNTQYVNDKSNWNCLCRKHQEEANEYWSDMWREYNNGRL